MPSFPEAFSVSSYPRALHLLQKCTATTSLKRARQLHALILTNINAGFRSPFVYNNIISMYARCGSFGDSQLVFDKMPQRNLVSFNSLISAYSRVSDHAISALELYTQMEAQNLRPNDLTFTSLLQAASFLEDRLVGSLLHAQSLRFGFLNDICVQTSLLSMYSNSGDICSAEKVFRGIVNKDVIAWNSFIFGHVKNSKIREGLHLFGDMISDGVVPTQFTYSMVLNACSRLKYYHFGQLIHAQVIVKSMQVDLPLENALLDLYCNCGNTQSAFSIFRKMENLDLVSWNTMIAGYSENEDGKMAMNLFVQLQALCFPKPDEYTFAAVISATGAFLASYYGKPLHAQVMKLGLKASIFVRSTLVSMYFRNGEIEAAESVFHSIPEKDTVLWTEMITGYSRMADGESAIKFFSEMCHEGHDIDSYVLSGALSACADLAILKQGEMIHSMAVKTGYDVEMSVSGTLVNMYAKNGRLEAAISSFSQVSMPDLKCWNSMLGGYSCHGMVTEALSLFEEILRQNKSPDEVTFLTLLSACSHRRLVEQGKFFWNLMKNFGFIPGPKHCACMVNLLSRAGLLEEAEEMINKVPNIENRLELWRTLLSSCVVNKNIRVGVVAAEEVLRLDQEDGATHILLSNLYAGAGRWDEVAEIRKRMRRIMVDKDPGLSWIEATGNIHIFSSGDQLHHKIDEVIVELHRLQGNMTRTETGENVNFEGESKN